MSKISDAAWFLLDRVFPVARPLPKAKSDEQDQRDRDELTEGRARVTAFPVTPDLVREYLDDLIVLLDEDQDRRQSVESRLTSIMGLSSIAGTVVFGGIIAQATGTIKSPSSTFKWGMALAGLYLTLQLCSAILAAVLGLSRRAFAVENSETVLPRAAEPQLDHYRRRARMCLEILIQNRRQTNDKVTQMAVAHDAMKNFLFGLLVVALAGSAFAARSQGSNDLVETLRKNHEVTEMLRGPQGPQGAQGPAGPKGEPGTPYANKPAPHPKAHKGGGGS